MDTESHQPDKKSKKTQEGSPQQGTQISQTVVGGQLGGTVTFHAPVSQIGAQYNHPIIEERVLTKNSVEDVLKLGFSCEHIDVCVRNRLELPQDSNSIVFCCLEHLGIPSMKLKQCKDRSLYIDCLYEILGDSLKKFEFLSLFNFGREFARFAFKQITKIPDEDKHEAALAMRELIKRFTEQFKLSDEVQSEIFGSFCDIRDFSSSNEVLIRLNSMPAVIAKVMFTKDPSARGEAQVRSTAATRQNKQKLTMTGITGTEETAPGAGVNSRQAGVQALGTDVTGDVAPITTTTTSMLPSLRQDKAPSSSATPTAAGVVLPVPERSPSPPPDDDVELINGLKWLIGKKYSGQNRDIAIGRYLKPYCDEGLNCNRALKSEEFAQLEKKRDELVNRLQPMDQKEYEEVKVKGFFFAVNGDIPVESSRKEVATLPKSDLLTGAASASQLSVRQQGGMFSGPFGPVHIEQVGVQYKDEELDLEGIKKKILESDLSDWLLVTTDAGSAIRLKTDLSIKLQYKTGEYEVREYKEEWWTVYFPDPQASSFTVSLYYKTELLDQILLVEVDGGRCVLPPIDCPLDGLPLVNSFTAKIARIVQNCCYGNYSFDEYLEKAYQNRLQWLKDNKDNPRVSRVIRLYSLLKQKEEGMQAIPEKKRRVDDALFEPSTAAILGAQKLDDQGGKGIFSGSLVVEEYEGQEVHAAILGILRKNRYVRIYKTQMTDQQFIDSLQRGGREELQEPFLHIVILRVHGNHWVTLLIDNRIDKPQQISYIDPMGTGFDTNLWEALQTWFDVRNVKCLDQEFQTTHVFYKKRDEQVMEYEPGDVVNCGVWVVKLVELYIQLGQLPVPADLHPDGRSFDINEERQKQAPAIRDNLAEVNELERRLISQADEKDRATPSTSAPKPE